MEFTQEQFEQIKEKLMPEIENNWAEWDKNGNGVIDMDEARPVLEPFISGIMQQEVTEETIKAAFLNSDADKSNGLSKQEVHDYAVKVLSTLVKK